MVPLLGEGNLFAKLELMLTVDLADSSIGPSQVRRLGILSMKLIAFLGCVGRNLFAGRTDMTYTEVRCIFAVCLYT